MNLRSLLAIASLVSIGCGAPPSGPHARNAVKSETSGPIVDSTPDAGDIAGYDCTELEDCYQQCPPSPEATLQSCRATCYANANPIAQRLSDSLSNCISAISCTTPSCIQSSCPTQLAACQDETDAGAR